MIEQIGITEASDPVFDHSWKSWVENEKPVILITKDPVTLYTLLNYIKHEKSKIIVHCTITGYGGTVLEPNVKDWKYSYKNGYLKFLTMLGPERTVLRIDPIIPTKKGIKQAMKIYNQLKYDMYNLSYDYNDYRIRISFLDNYSHIKTRFKENGVKQIPYDFHANLKVRKKVYELMEHPEICGEPDMYNIPCVSERDAILLGVLPEMKRKGQRKTCGCIANKTEILNSPCEHGCLYCYWK